MIRNNIEQAKKAFERVIIDFGDEEGKQQTSKD